MQAPAALNPIFLPSPLNTDHPLAPDHWWVVLPGLDGGRFWYDIGARAPAHGTLTNMTTSASGWRGTTRPGGFGEVRFDGTDDYVDGGTASSLNPGTGDWSVSLWVKTTASTRQTLVQKYTYSGGGNPEQGWYIDLLATGAIRCIVESDTTNVVFRDSSVAVNDGGWHCVGFTRVGVTVTVYVDGRDRTTGGSLAGTPGNVTSANSLRLGYPSGSFSNYAAISADALMLHPRPLSAAEMWSLFTETRLGCPGLLRRVRSPLGGGGPVTYTQLLTATQGQSPSVRRGVGVVRGCSQGQAPSVFRSIGKPIAGVQAQAASATRAVGRSVAASQAQAALATRSAGKGLDCAQAQAGAASRGVAVTRAVEQGQVGAVSRGVGKALTAEQGQASPLSRVVARALLAAQSVAAVMVRVVHAAHVFSHTLVRTRVGTRRDAGISAHGDEVGISSRQDVDVTGGEG